MSVESTVPSDEEVIEAFQAYVDERAASGVLFAKAVVSVTFDGSTLLVKFDPSSAGCTEDAFVSLNPFETLAQFAGTPVAFTDDVGRKLRTRVELVRAVFSDGRDLGTMTVPELFRKGAGLEWKPGL